MFWYLLRFVIAVCLWYLIKWLMDLRLHLDILKKVPFHEDMDSPLCTKIFKKIKTANDVLDIVRDWVVKTDVQMFAMWYLSRSLPKYVIVKPGLMKELLKLPITEDKGPIANMLKPWLGEGLALSNGHKWERNRRLLTPAFHFEILKNYVIVFNREADIWLDIVNKASSEGTSVNIQPLIKSATLETMLRCALSNGEDGDVQRIGFRKVLERRIMNPLYKMSDFLWSLTADGKEFKKNCDYVHEFAFKIITSRRQILESETESTEAKTRRPDFLDEMGVVWPIGRS